MPRKSVLKPQGPYSFRGTARWKRTRLAVLKRDKWTCRWCGEYADQADHVQPVSQGGARFDMGNLVASCGPCNRARPVHAYAGSVHSEGGRFFRGGSALYVPRHVLSPLKFDPRTAIGSPVRNPYQTASPSAKSEQAPTTPLEPADAPTEARHANMHAYAPKRGARTRVITADYTRREPERGAG
jgi:hypothetical protein